jgi:hypothetical protein
MVKLWKKYKWGHCSDIDDNDNQFWLNDGVDDVSDNDDLNDDNEVMMMMTMMMEIISQNT